MACSNCESMGLYSRTGERERFCHRRSTLRRSCTLCETFHLHDDTHEPEPSNPDSDEE